MSSQPTSFASNSVLSNAGRIRQSLLVTAILLTIVPNLGVIYAGKTTGVDVCYINREFQSPPPTFIPIRDGQLHDLSVFCMWGAMFLLCLLPKQRPIAFFRLLYASIWFHSTYILLAALKSLLADYNCAGRHKLFPNGISGHYCYFIFVSLTAFRLGRARLKAHKDIRRSIEVLAEALLSVFLVGAATTLYRTYFHGYHSPRQICLGMALGIASFVGLDSILFPTRGRNSIGFMISVLLANSLTSITMYFQWWPHTEAGPAISGQQLVFHSILWLLLLSDVFVILQPERKQS